jgi:hypothetical protein
LKTTIGKSLDEVVKLPRNRTKSDINLSDSSSYRRFKQNTGATNISQKTRNTVIKRINELIAQTVLENNYNIRIPNLGIVTLIKYKANNMGYGAKTKKGDMVGKIHIYFQVSGEERRVQILDFDFSENRKYKRHLKKILPHIMDNIKESF